MKFKILIIVFVIFFCTNLSAQNKFSIIVTMPKGARDLIVTLTNSNFPIVYKTSVTRNGAYVLDGIIQNPYEFILFSVSNRTGKYFLSMRIFIKPEIMRIKIIAFGNNLIERNVIFENVPFLKEKRIYDSLIAPAERNLNYELNKLLAANKSDKDSLKGIVKRLQRQYANEKIDFIKKMSKSYFGIYLFNDKIINSSSNVILSGDELMSVYSIFSDDLKRTSLGKSIYNVIVKKQLISLNRILPDFTFCTDKGVFNRLSNFSDKYILLCFWDSYCGPCIRSFPIVKKIDSIYSRYGLQVVYVSIDTTETIWRSSLERYNVPGIQTCNVLSCNDTGETLQSLYSITYIPQYFLIDKDRKSIYHNVMSNDNDDYDVLHKILEKIFLVN